MLVHVLAIIQAVVLPGYVVWRAARIPTRSLGETSLTILCLSALANFAAVSAATALGIGIGPAAPWLVAAEGAFVAFDLLRRRRESGSRAAASTGAEAEPVPAPAAPVAIAVAAGLATAALLLLFALRHYGAVFSEWDTIFSWNEWALDWWSGHFPNLTWLYPQLVPANWSLVYSIVGSVEVQALPKSLMALYPVAGVLMLADVGARTRSLGRAAAAVVFGLVVWLGFATNMDSGGVDLAAGFFALGAFCTLPDPDHPFAPAGPRHHLAPLAFAAAAACTKQSGLLVLAVVCAVALISTIAHARTARDGRSVLPAAGVLAVPAAVAVIAYLPGYLSMPEGGVAATSFGGIAAAMGDAGLLARLSRAAGMTATQQPWLLLVAALVIVSGIRRRDLLAILAVVVPWALVWAVTLSYDFRNLAFVLPLAAFAAGSAMPSLEMRGPRAGGSTAPPPRLRRWVGSALGVAPIASLSVMCLVAIAFVVANGASLRGLTEDQLARQGRIGSPDLNVELERVVGRRATGATILTDYRFLPQLPLYRSDPRRVTLAAGTTTVYADSKDISLDDLARRPRFAVLTDAVAPPVERELESLVRSGAYRLLGTFPGGPGNFGDARVRVLESASATSSPAP